MRISVGVLLAACLGCGLLVEREAHATTEIPAQYDGRAVALGGTGTSYVENGASVYLNPAAMDGIKSFAGTVVVSPFLPTLTAPLTGPNSSVTSDTSVFPLFLAGAAFRLSDRIVVGFGVYPTVGMGVPYKVMGQEASVAVGQFEASPAISFKIIDGLSLGLAYRATYTTQTVKQPGPAPLEMNLNGMNWFSLQAGVYYRPTEDLHLGFSYRSRVNTTISGTTETAGMKLDTTSEFNSPDRFKLGVSYAFPGKVLFVAADVKYLLYEATNKQVDSTVMMPVPGAPPGTFAPNSTVQRLDWKNSFGVGAGAELRPLPLLAVRAGYSLAESATPKHTANAFMLPPGLVHGFHAGAGLSLANVDLDLGGYYTFARSSIGPNPAAPGVVPGDYKMDSLLFALSATYKM